MRPTIFIHLNNDTKFFRYCLENFKERCEIVVNFYGKKPEVLEFVKQNAHQVFEIKPGGKNEIVKGLSIVGNYFLMNARGNEILPLRNENGDVTNFTPMEYIQKQEFYCVGLKYNFSEKTHLSFFVEQCKTTSKAYESYGINQALIYYIMKF